MNPRKILGTLAGFFLAFGVVGLFFHMMESSSSRAQEGAPIASLVLLVLGTACVAFLVKNPK